MAGALKSLGLGSVIDRPNEKPNAGGTYSLRPELKTNPINQTVCNPSCQPADYTGGQGEGQSDWGGPDGSVQRELPLGAESWPPRPARLPAGREAILLSGF